MGGWTRLIYESSRQAVKEEEKGLHCYNQNTTNTAPPRTTTLYSHISCCPHPLKERDKEFLGLITVNCSLKQSESQRERERERRHSLTPSMSFEYLYFIRGQPGSLCFVRFLTTFGLSLLLRLTSYPKGHSST